MAGDLDTETWVEEFINDLLDRTGLDVAIEEISVDEEDTLSVQISGPDSARVIGREGQTLDAFQHIIVSSSIHNGAANQRILIDVENYRERREQRVLDEATRLAEKALETGEVQEAAPMSPRERRLVHMVVSKIDGLSTESAGTGDDRYVRIIPRNP